MSKISRNTFLKIIVAIFAAFLGYLTLGIFDNQRKTGFRKVLTIEINNDFPEGISFQNNLIINRNDGNIKIFSSRCPHLGCLINKYENNELICPCHGSRFTTEGKVISGPASKDLKKLNYKITGNKLIVFMEEDV